MNEAFNLDYFKKDNGVYILSEIKDDFELIYLNTRKKERRIYNDDELSKLPFATDSNPNKNEWLLRSKSFNRFRQYLKTKEQNLNILDLGCGNGWFCGQLSELYNQNYYCVDVNLMELKQGKRVFNSENLIFIYADVFNAKIPKSFYDLVIVNSAVQYFQDLQILLNHLLSLLNVNGEIHIIDSPFYDESEVGEAKKRTADYYRSIGFPEMIQNYFHHSFSELSAFKVEILYNPKSLPKRIMNLFVSDCPFPWIRIKK